MSFNPITAILEIGELAIKRIWPDPERQAEEQRKLAELAQSGNLAELDAQVKLMLGQVEINKIEAQSGSLFIAGWRPAIGWVAAVALALAYIPKAIAMTALWSVSAWAVVKTGGVLPEFPDLGLSDLLGLMGSMLGIGIMRSFDKRQGTQTNRIR